MPDDGANAAGQRIRRHECGGEHHHDQHEVLEEQGRRGGLGGQQAGAIDKRGEDDGEGGEKGDGKDNTTRSGSVAGTEQDRGEDDDAARPRGAGEICQQPADDRGPGGRPGGADAVVDAVFGVTRNRQGGAPGGEHNRLNNAGGQEEGGVIDAEFRRSLGEGGVKDDHEQAGYCHGGNHYGLVADGAQDIAVPRGSDCSERVHWEPPPVWGACCAMSPDPAIAK